MPAFAIEDGGALLTNVGQEEIAPRFDTDMRPNEVMELVVVSLGLVGSVKVEGTGLRPAEFGSTRGFRFERALQTQDGLIKCGLAVGTMQDGKLQLIVYLAAELYCYEEYLDEVEGIVASVQLT